MDSERWIRLEERYTCGVYTKHPVVLVRGAGTRVWDADGREYVDCATGHGVALLGHGHPRVLEAIREQSERLMTCSEAFYNDRRAELEAELISLAPWARRVFLCNSGAEAVEAAIKFARLVTGRPGVVAARNGFHGRTMGALSATWRPEYRRPFEPLVPGFVHVPYNRPEPLEEAIGPQTAAVILEVVQGEGGVHVGDGTFLRRAQDLCRQRGALLIVDEIQTGLGRTGRMLACEHYGLEPDIVCLAKGLGGGLPMGAVLLGERVGQLPPAVHGSTFGGNPLACAAALAVLRTLREERLPEQAAELGDFFLERLKGLRSPLVREVRGLGLMVGVELRRRARPYIRALVQRGVLALPAGPLVVRFLPPLTIAREDLEFVVRRLEEALAEPVEEEGAD
ncbi:MAG: acetylornithine/succinylornithine family transaminase [Anaerolineae bacterium]|nr:acetylornithine/succinylornithine family transaminase [Anaerolineae bacterium]MCX8067804.1 acetylornithine/succinylornithine family transaminase [Anaerolineae bacterium]MDW7990996.1 acetylornithine/succinylornithine family transaminase [Anaerolineae bacterium]